MMKKILIFLGLLLAALVERLWFDLGPNVELIMTSSVLASMYLGKKWGATLAVLALGLSDLVIGNTMIMVFTWSAFFVIGWGGKWITKWSGNKQIVAAGGYGLASALWFYFYTNFGVWLLSGIYKRTLAGLIQSYIMGLPFLRIHAISSGLLLPLSLILVKITKTIFHRVSVRIHYLPPYTHLH